MNESSLLPIFLIGLLGNLDCVGMCGGIVYLFALQKPHAPPVMRVRLRRFGAQPPSVLSKNQYRNDRMGQHFLCFAADE